MLMIPWPPLLFSVLSLSYALQDGNLLQTLHDNRIPDDDVDETCLLQKARSGKLDHLDKKLDEEDDDENDEDEEEDEELEVGDHLGKKHKHKHRSKHKHKPVHMKCSPDLSKCTCGGMVLGKGHTGESVDQKHSSDFKLTHPDQGDSVWSYSAFLRGKEVRLERFRSKVAIVVNIASG
eukprot:gnl/TRDRNA2_/TRDRNA2_91654_c0_seq1.p2 gnl/TRDRNA2_/TRDRNA2_91654_c0~~gnl/TRDRNA2_/TRDRNA2_91654_c0_seq1.p2  ORF type:complete len:178 (+),score=39.89 gnl/TRDRNA2_/TRDRNA2_91654_c0_seq1:71-604(+)